MKYFRDVIATFSVACGLVFFGLILLSVGVILALFAPIVGYNLGTVEDQ